MAYGQFRNLDEWARFWGKDGEPAENPYAGTPRPIRAAVPASPEAVARRTRKAAYRETGEKLISGDIDADQYRALIAQAQNPETTQERDTTGLGAVAGIAVNVALWACLAGLIATACMGGAA